MNKKEAINIIQECAQKYHRNLENNNFLFISNSTSGTLQPFETIFLKRNFLHLTGIRLENPQIKSSMHFYDICLDQKLSMCDFHLARNGTTELKLQILPQILDIPYCAKMIGDYFNSKNLLLTEKLVGNISICLGFTQDKNGCYVPNTVLKENIKKVTMLQDKIIAILKKKMNENQYHTVTYINKNYDIQEIERKLNASNIQIYLRKTVKSDIVQAY